MQSNKLSTTLQPTLAMITVSNSPAENDDAINRKLHQYQAKVRKLAVSKNNYYTKQKHCFGVHQVFKEMLAPNRFY